MLRWIVQKFPYLRDHQVDGEIVFPATGHMELAWAVASEQFRHESFFLENLHFDSPLILPDNSRHPLDVRLEIVSGEGDYRICSRPADADTDSPWSKHSSDASTRCTTALRNQRSRWRRSNRNFKILSRPRSRSFTNTFASRVWAYGENFQCIKQLNHGCDWLAEIRLPDELVHESTRTNIHPA